MKKYIVLFCACAIFLFFIMTGIKNPAEDIMNEVEFAKSKMGSIYEDISVDAKLNIEKEKIISNDSGYVKIINVKQGEKVFKGDILCYIEQEDSKQTSVILDDEKNIELEDIIPKEVAEQINFDDFNISNPVDLLKVFEKYKDIFADIDLDALKKAFENSKTAAGVISKKTEETNAPGKIIEIYAPSDGIITNIYVNENDSISALSPVFEICKDFDGMVSSHMPASAAGKIHAGSNAEVLINNIKVNAKITEVSNISRTAGGKEVFDLKARISDKTSIDYYVENVKMNIKSKVKDNTVIVPSSSVVMSDDDKNYVYVMDNNKLYKKYVDIDEDNDRQASVAAGLYANQTIIKNPLEFEKKLKEALKK